jgi:glycosyltransferase involved in cell wall biosynthesis
VKRAGGFRISRSSTGAPDSAAAGVAEQQRLLADRLATLRSATPSFRGRGIVTAIGSEHIVGGWVLLTLLRNVHQCSLPIEVWHLGDADLPPDVRAAFERFEVTFVDASHDPRITGPRPTNGWTLKAYAIALSRFAEVLWLDADLLPLLDPATLFEEPAYRSTGALFWPDIRRVNRFNPIWAIAGATAPDGPEFESGIIVLDKVQHWPELLLTLHFNQQSDFYYRYLMGDKDTFQLAWRLRNAPCALPSSLPEIARGSYPRDRPDQIQLVGLWQHDFGGNRIALHQTDARLVAWGRNPAVAGFPYVAERDAALAELRRVWNGDLGRRPAPRLLDFKPTEIAGIRRFAYLRPGLEWRDLELLPGGRIGAGARELERFWRIDDEDNEPRLILSSRALDSSVLHLQADGSWHGAWLEHEQGPAELIPLAEDAPPRPKSDGPRLLYITPVAPAETGNGVAMRAAQVLRHLTATYRVSLLILPLYQNVEVAAAPRWMSERCADIRWAWPPVPYDEAAVTPDEYSAWQDAWVDEIGRAYHDESFDTIHLFRTSVLALAQRYLKRPDLQRATIQLDLDDVESRTQRRLAGLYARYGHEADRNVAEQRSRVAFQIERQLLTEWDRLFVCSEMDRIELEQRLPNGRAEIVVLPNRVHLPAIPPSRADSGPLTILYVGTLGYFPNADGLSWFCREVLPRMREWSPLELRLFVVGSGALDDVRDLGHIPEVEIIGEVERLDEWYARADLVIVPLRAGGGTRIKLIEALAYQRPVVSTTLAAEGLDVQDGTHLLIGDRPAIFARQCLRLLEDRDLAARLAANGRALVEARYAIPTD